jgi:hypothetical protein
MKYIIPLGYRPIVAEKPEMKKNDLKKTLAMMIYDDL